MEKNIAVVGAGIAGLTAAYYLQKFGYSVTVYEQSNRVGGRMTTDRVNDCLIDRGAQFISSDYSTIIPLIHELGMSDDLVNTSKWMGIVRKHKIRKISADHALSPLTSGYLSLKEALQFLLKMRGWQSSLLTLPLNDYAAWADFDNEYADTFIRREFGEHILEYLIEPQMQGFHYQSPEESSKIHALMLLSYLLRKGKIMSLRNGMGSLPEILAKQLNIKFNCPISAITAEKTGKVSLESNAATFCADKVILAIPAPIGKSIFRFANALEATLLNTKYNATINIGIATDVNWKLPRKLKDVYGILIPRLERQTIAGIGIESNKSANRIKDGELIDIMLDSHNGAKLLNKPDDSILNTILPELENYLPKLSESIHFTHVTHWKNAEPISSLGRSKIIKKYNETLNSSARVILAGDYMGCPHTDSAAFTGKWAAEFIKCVGN